MGVVVSLYTSIFEVYQQNLWPFSSDSLLVVHGLPFGAIFIYACMLIFLPKFLVSRKKEQTPEKKGVLTRFDYFLAGWNFFLSFFSALFFFLGMIPYTWKECFLRLSFFNGFCNSDYKKVNYVDNPHTEIFWIYMFIMFKFVELFDTVFMIVRKPERKVSFLHWYHHITVLFVSYYAFNAQLTLGFFFGLLNSFVHMLMYFYYGMVTIGKKINFAFFITILQIIQMLAGLVLIILWGFFVISGEPCHCSGSPTFMIISFGIIYLSYFILFLRFLVNRYFRKSPNVVEKTSSV